MPVVDSVNAPLKGVKARRLTDMAGVEHDMRWTAGACAQLSRRQTRHNIDMQALEAIHDAALIRYARCFKQGRRDAFQIPTSWIAEMPERLRETHAQALALRDKHIAHSVNDWEVNVPVAQLVTNKDTGETTVRAIHVTKLRVLMLGLDDLDTLWHLAKALADCVVAQMEVLKANLLEDTRRLDIDRLKRRIRSFPQAGRRRVDADRARA